MALRSTLSLLLTLLGISCAEGGEEDRPLSEVLITASHHMWALQSDRAFSTFPIPMAEMASDRGVLTLDDQSLYTVTRNGQASGTDDYALAEDGVLSILVSQGARLPRIRFSGAYGIEGDTGTYFFTDRFTAQTSQRIGLFWGTEVVDPTPDLEGDWHVFSQHVIFASSIVPDPNNVGRAFGGTLAVDDMDDITGSGLESTGANITLTGNVASFADGRVDVTLDYAGPQTSDTRTFHGSVGPGIILGLDPDETTGESGLIAMMAHRTTPADRDDFAGTYLLGLHTIFVNPTNPGTDVAFGTVTFNDTDGFSLDATGADGQDFSYSGTYVLDDDGTLTLTVPGTSETWMGAVDEEYHTVVFVDNFIEARAGAKPPELNLFLALREAPVPSNP